MNKPLTSEEFKNIYSKVPRLTVEVVLKEPGGVVLTLRSIEPKKGWWHIPGGTVYFKELVEEAVIRVAKEELGVEVKVDKFLGFIDYKHESDWGWFGRTVGLAYLVERVSGELKGSEQGQEVKMFKAQPKKIIEDQGKFLKDVGLLA